MRRARVAVLGMGRGGRHRLGAMVEDGRVDVVGVAEDLDGLLALEPDGVVVDTPSGPHAAQCLRILDGGAAVFCWEPLGRDAAEVQAVVAAARRADRLLGVDFSYRHHPAIRPLEALAREGGLGRVYAADLVLHHADGPDAGCVADLGVQLVDLALWLLGAPDVEEVRSSRWARGRRLTDAAGPHEGEDHAVAELQLEGGAVVRLSCHRRLPTGQEPRISVELWGTRGGASVHDAVAHGRDAWRGRATVAWCRQLAEGARFDPSAEHYLRVAELVDDLYPAW